MHRHRTARLAAAIAASSALLLAACANNEPEQPAPTETTEAAPAETTQTAETSADTPTSTAMSGSGASTSTSPKAKDRELVDDVAERFATLAPASLFDKFETCSETDIRGSYDCSGPEIGQFQLFDSEAKAASTTQLLTELRSSRIVSDEGSHVVGWSTLGTSAIITVVDNEKGQVLQQLVSSDQDDPRERIYKLGLAERPEPGAEETTATATEAETTATAPSAARS